MSFEPYSVRCPVHKGEVQVKDSGQCPVCDTDLSALLAWRQHALSLYERATEAAETQRWRTAEALSREALAFEPDFREAKELLSKVERHREGNRLRLAWLGLPLIFLLLFGGLFLIWPRLQIEPERVRVPVVVTATPSVQVAEASDLEGRESPTSPVPTPETTATELPTLAPSPTKEPPPCPDLLARVRAALSEMPAAEYMDVWPEVTACTVMLHGRVPTERVQRDIVRTVASQEPDASVEASQIDVVPVYVIGQGDTLWWIAEHLYGSSKYWRRIYAANRQVITNARTLPVGLEIRLPLDAEYLKAGYAEE